MQTKPSFVFNEQFVTTSRTKVKGGILGHHVEYHATS